MCYEYHSAQIIGKDVIIETTLVRNYCVVAILTIFLYERVNTAVAEIHNILTRSITAVSVLYYAMNSLTLVYLLLYMAICWDSSCTNTYRLEIAASVISSVLLFIYGAISALRVHALNGRHYILPCVIISLFLVGMGANLYHCAYLSSVRSRLHGCRVISNIPDLIIPRSTLPHMCAIKVVDSHARPLEIALRLSNMLAEVLVVAATWRATFGLARQTGNIRYFHWHTSLITLLLRHGSIYFVILLSLNIAAAALWTKNSFQDVSLFFHTFSTIVLSRFFLNLRTAASPMPTSHIFTQAAQEFSFSLRFGIGEETDNEGESDTGELEHGEEAEHDIDSIFSPSITLSARPLTPRHRRLDSQPIFPVSVRPSPLCY